MQQRVAAIGRRGGVEQSLQRSRTGDRRRLPAAIVKIPQHEESQQFQQSTSLEDIVKQLIEGDEVTRVEDYWSETEKGREVFRIEPKIVIASNEEEDNEIKIDVISYKPEKPLIESKKGQPLVLVKPPTLPCTFIKPYKGVEVKKRSQIFYTVDTFMLDDHDATDSFVLEVPNELSNLKEGVHFSLPEHIDAPFVVDISKGEDIT
ncbi:hypothetical protein Syun_028353 [Stephania yunnanensis]|uniref:Uncharacterized protein n=1 Tax=Stephania yunnanensis TaxID=152371 RepID=A0AAP0EKL6_9MAGN